jgi:hypothetical protein
MQNREERIFKICIGLPEFGAQFSDITNYSVLGLRESLVVYLLTEMHVLPLTNVALEIS